MNRDWFSQSQPETRGRIAAMLDWFPHVVVDLHEMGGDSSYYFAPPGAPDQPARHAGADASRSSCSGAPTRRSSTSAASPTSCARTTTSSIRATASRGRSSTGAIGMTYEQASPRGLVWKRSDGDLAVVSRRDRPPLHRRDDDRRDRRTAPGDASCASSSSTAAAPFRRANAAAVREYVIVPGHDPSRARLLARDARDAGDRGPARRRGDQGGLADDSSRRVPRVERAAGRTAAAETCSIPIRRRTKRSSRNRIGGGELRLGRRDLRHHRVEPSARLRRRDRHERRRADRALRADAPSRPQSDDIAAAPLPPARVGYLLPWGSADGGGRRRSAARRHPHPARRAAVHAGRPQVSDGHGDRSRLGQRHAIWPQSSVRSWRGTKPQRSPSTAAIRTRESRSAAGASRR